MDRIIVAFRGEETRRRILRLLALEGREGVPCAGGAEALRAVRRLGEAVRRRCAAGQTPPRSQ